MRLILFHNVKQLWLRWNVVVMELFVSKAYRLPEIDADGDNCSYCYDYCIKAPSVTTQHVDKVNLLA